MTTSYLRFRMDSQRYALPLASVRELIEYVAPARLPGAPRVLAGMINVRGEPLPLVDLAYRLGITLQSEPKRRPTMIVEVTWERGVVAFAMDTDDVDGIISVDEATLSPGSPFAKAPPPKYLRGVLAEDDEVTLILAVEQLLSEEELLAAEGGHSADEAHAAKMP